ncbi:hypothetical protein OG609_29590 [Streptomyces sp. NBC_01224]|uniref:hypothetical protein n=1 Tax=unclassified Streptomyces TaxID=2593676 RepID=UPI002E139D6F|nr:hypothetical protein OG609_29590 [Streptomyces sp. NBC_01224]
MATRDATAYTREHIAAINRSRRAKALSMAAGEQLRRGGQDLALRTEAEGWLRLRTRLM